MPNRLKYISILRSMLRKLSDSRSVGIATSTVLGCSVLYMTVLVCQGAADLEHTAVRTPVAVPHHLVQVSQVAKPVVAPPAPAPTPAPAAKPPVTKVTSKLAAAARPTPVVTPAPGSSVDSLTPTTPTPPATSTGSATTTGYTSTNWSGYLIASQNFTAVSGSWTATRPAGIGNTISADSTWIGIGGVSASDLIQVGTQNIIAPNGQVQTSAFYEILPAAEQSIASLTVSPGDAMSAAIAQVSPGQWSITITDATTGQTYSTTVVYASSLSSAEWIEEDPSFSNNRQIPFDSFGEATFTGALTTANGSSVNLAGGNAQPITMVNRSGQVVAAPSAINAGGTGFQVSP